MTTRSFAAVGTRLLGVYLLATAVLEFVSASILVGHSDIPWAVTYLAAAPVMAAVGLLLVRQDDWIAGLMLHGDEVGRPNAQFALSLNDLRTFAFGVLGCVAALAALGRFGDHAAGEKDLLRTYTIVGYVTVALGALLAPIARIRSAPTDRSGSPPIRRDELESVAWTAACVWFSVNAVSAALSLGWTYAWWPSYLVGQTVGNAALAALSLRARARHRKPLRDPSSQVGLEVAALLLLFMAVPNIAAFLSGFVNTPEATFVSRIPALTPLALAFYIAVALGLLLWVNAQQRHGPPWSGPPTDVFD